MVFVMGPPGPQRMWAPGPILRPSQLNGPGWGVFF